jgi:threonine/homoserine/homoserine lactone efflux protein
MAQSENFWLRRATILFQLNYKAETDFGLLCEIIRENLGSKEFFINKAIGWALRQYTRVDPEAVREFVAATPLHPLERARGLEMAGEERKEKESSNVIHLPNLPVFLLAALILLLTPGPAVLYIVARSMDQGRLAGFISVLGIEVGNSFHVLAATMGLSAILLSSAVTFSVVKYLGAAYLVYLGVRRLLTRGDHYDPPRLPKPEPLRRVFTQGVVGRHSQPEDGFVLFSVLAAVCRPVHWLADLAIADARRHVRDDGHRDGRNLCAFGKHSRQLAEKGTVLFCARNGM